MEVEHEPLVNELHREQVEHLDSNHTDDEVVKLVLRIGPSRLRVDGVN